MSLESFPTSQMSFPIGSGMQQNFRCKSPGKLFSSYLRPLVEHEIRGEYCQLVSAMHTEGDCLTFWVILKRLCYECTQSLHFSFWFCWNWWNCCLESVIFEFSLLSHTYVFKLALHIYISWQKLIGMLELQVETCLLRLCTKIYSVLLFC
jgi:hypothetical protein